MIALVVGALVGYGWLSGVLEERSELRDRFSRLSRDYSAPRNEASASKRSW